MRTNKLKRSEKKRLKEEEREQRLREREIARLPRNKEFNFCIGLLYIDLCQSDRISGLF